MTRGPLFAEDPDDTVPAPADPAARLDPAAPLAAEHTGGPAAGPHATDRHAGKYETTPVPTPPPRAENGRSAGGLAGALTGEHAASASAASDEPDRRPSAPPTTPATGSTSTAASPAARLRARDAYRIRDGRYEPDTWWTRLRAQLGLWSKSERERALEDVDRQLKKLRMHGVRNGQLVAVGSAKGGTGKDTLAIILGDVAARALGAPTLVLDGDWDFGTLGERAPEEGRSPGTILDVHERRHTLTSPAELGPFVARLPSGCHLLSAPRDPEAMDRLEVKHYAETVAALKRFYSVIFVTMAPGVLAPICRWAFASADQIVFVTDPRLVTADQTLRALPLLRKRHPKVPLQLIINQVPSRPTTPQQHVIDAQAANGLSDATVQIPWDQRLEQQLDSGTFDLDDPDLPAATKLALKQATLTVARQFA